MLRWSRIRLRGLLALVALAALVLCAAKTWYEGIETHWRVAKLRWGSAAQRKSAAEALMGDADQSSSPFLHEGWRRGQRIAIDALLDSMDDPDVDVRLAVMFALRSMVVYSGDVQRRPLLVERLIKSARSSNERIQRAAIAALGRFPDHAEASLPVLVAALDDNEPPTRREAVSALAMIGGRNREHAAAIARRLQTMTDDAEPRVRSRAMAGVVQMARRDMIDRAMVIGVILPRLVRGIDDADAQVRSISLRLLGSGAFEPWGQHTTARVRDALADPDRGVRFDAAEQMVWRDLADERIPGIVLEAARAADRAPGNLGGSLRVSLTLERLEKSNGERQ